MTRLSDQHFTMPDAPVFGFEDPFFDSAGMTSRESEHRLSSEHPLGARVGRAAGSRSSGGSDTLINKGTDNGNRR